MKFNLIQPEKLQNAVWMILAKNNHRGGQERKTKIIFVE